MTNATQFDREAATGNFVVAYAESARPSWSVGFCCAGPDSNAVDDVGFLNHLLDQLQRDYRIDAARVYAVGVSAGAMMAYRWACADAERIAGVGSVAGAMLFDSCHPAKPVSVIEIHGTIEGGGHTWYTPDYGPSNGAVDATHEIWSYLSSHAQSS
jgi:polyhydroxybutyrate depolymerase